MTGQPVRIDRAGPADLDAVRGFYARLGDASTYYRFFGLRRHIPEGELLGVVGESAHHVTLLASIGPELIGIGEFIIGKQPTEAEVAFAVADDHHREESPPSSSSGSPSSPTIEACSGSPRPSCQATPTCNSCSEPSASPSAAVSTMASSRSSWSSPR